MASLKFHPGPPCPTLLRPAGGPPLKRPYGRFWGGPPRRAGGLRPSRSLLDAPRRTPVDLVSIRVRLEIAILSSESRFFVGGRVEEEVAQVRGCGIGRGDWSVDRLIG
jgi:hypothetical protein